MSKAKRVTTSNGVDALAMSPNVRTRAMTWDDDGRRESERIARG